MEHPDVIREIETLIDSYNWAALVDDHDGFIDLLKQEFQTQSSEIFFHLYQSISHTQFFMFQLFIKMLQHPRVTHKAWILESLSHLTTVAVRHRHDSAALILERRHVLPEAASLLRRYTKHRRPAYRFHAVIALSRLTPHPDRATRCYLNAVHCERSFQTRVRIFEHLGAEFVDKSWNPIQPNKQTKADVILYLNNALRCKSLLMRLAASVVFVQVMQKKTPQWVLDQIAADWSLLDGRQQTHQDSMVSILQCIHHLEKSTFLNVVIALLLNSRSFMVALRVWWYIEQHYFPDYVDLRRAAFTAQEKRLIEALSRCKPLWRIRHPLVPEWENGHRMYYGFHPEYQGLETTRAALCQQLKHARLIDESEKLPPSDTVNLISYPVIG